MLSFSEYEGHCLINVRVYCTGTDGIDRPTPKGVAMAVRKLPELARALVKAEAKARELGLLGRLGAGRMNAATLTPSQTDFAALCTTRAQLLVDGTLLMCQVVDELQAVAEHSGPIPQPRLMAITVRRHEGRIENHVAQRQ